MDSEPAPGISAFFQHSLSRGSAVSPQGGYTPACQSWLRRNRTPASRSFCRLSRRRLRWSPLPRPVSILASASSHHSPWQGPIAVCSTVTMRRAPSIGPALSSTLCRPPAEKVMMLKKAKEDADAEIAAYKRERERLFQLFSTEVRPTALKTSRLRYAVPARFGILRCFHIPSPLHHLITSAAPPPLTAHG